MELSCYDIVFLHDGRPEYEICNINENGNHPYKSFNISSIKIDDLNELSSLFLSVGSKIVLITYGSLFNTNSFVRFISLRCHAIFIYCGNIQGFTNSMTNLSDLSISIEKIFVYDNIYRMREGLEIINQGRFPNEINDLSSSGVIDSRINNIQASHSY